MKPRPHIGEFIRIEDETDSVKRFWIRVPEVENFDFIPGQFVTLDLPIHEKRGKRIRSYSIASAPNGSNIFELVIVDVPGGAGTTYLWDDVKEGTKVNFIGPLGKFTLPEHIDHDICLVCTGTGIAPFRSMLLDLHRNPRDHRHIYLIFGTRHLSNVLYYKEMEALAAKMPHLDYIVALSREMSPQWKGKKGYVHPIYEDIFADKRPAHFYICGWRQMIDEARKRISSMGYDKKAIHVEIYG